MNEVLMTCVSLGALALLLWGGLLLSCWDAERGVLAPWELPGWWRRWRQRRAWARLRRMG